MLFCFVRIANKHKTILFSLPHSCHSNLKVLYTILYSHLLFQYKLIIFSLWIVSQIICLESPLIIMSCFKPCHHWMIICLSYQIFVCPLIVFRLILVEWFWLWFQWILVISESKSIVVVTAIFLNAEYFCIRETSDKWKLGFLF